MMAPLIEILTRAGASAGSLALLHALGLFRLAPQATWPLAVDFSAYIVAAIGAVLSRRSRVRTRGRRLAQATVVFLICLFAYVQYGDVSPPQRWALLRDMGIFAAYFGAYGAYGYVIGELVQFFLDKAQGQRAGRPRAHPKLN